MKDAKPERQSAMNKLIAIDPGVSGGIAVATEAEPFELGNWNPPEVHKMPETLTDIMQLIRGMLEEDPCVKAECWMENVGGYMPGNSGPASVKFARHCGFLEGVLVTFKVPIIKVTPSKWMRWLLPSVPEEKKDRKNAIKSAMQLRYPHINKMALWGSDALGILTYAINQHKGKTNETHGGNP
jgi:hypothetical protein